MARRSRIAIGGLGYHVINRRVGGLQLFESYADYSMFENILQEAYERSGVSVAAYCLMPNHWHLLFWLRHDDELSETIRWISVTHSARWRSAPRNAGNGPLYEGRFRSFPVQTDWHFSLVANYIEQNPLRKGLAYNTGDWPWSSLWRRNQEDAKLTEFLGAWPDEPLCVSGEVNETGAEVNDKIQQIRHSVQYGRPFGDDEWMLRTAKELRLESTLRPRGRPKQNPNAAPFYMHSDRTPNGF
jgi:putative transposase